MNAVHNILAIARREFLVRVRTRSFLVGTFVLVLGVSAIALVPVIVRYFDRADTQNIAVHLDASQPPPDLVTTLGVLLNATPDTGQSQGTNPAHFRITSVDDLDAARAAVGSGTYAAALAVERAPDGDLAFTLYTDASATGRTAQLLQQASAAAAIGDRLRRLGIEPVDQAGLFAPARFAVKFPDPTRADESPDSTSFGTKYLLGFGMTILIFMMIILYGNWVAMSVVEEKSSRVMEVVLNAATPFQLLTGKVLGVGAVAFSQYLAIVAAAVVALLLQAPVASLVLGEGSGGAGLPEGLTIPMLVFFGIYGVLGFLLYAVLYAAAGSLVSRQEDVNQAVMPMTLVSTGGYMVAVYGATGLLDVRSGGLAVLSQVPFVSPFMMVSRLTSGEASAVEVVLSIGLLLVTIAGALWLAGRIYAAGVLLYGQRPGLRSVLRLIREGM